MKRLSLFVVLAVAAGFISLGAQAPGGSAVVKLDPALDQIISTNAKLEIGTPIFLQMSVGNHELALNGVVVYSDPGHGVGVRFHDLSEADENFLKNELGSL